MNTNRDLNYRLYIQRLNGFTRTSYQNELEKYMVIQSGDVETAKKNFSKIRPQFLSGKGKLSDNPVNNVRYHFIVSAAMTSRVCVDGGMNHDFAYTLSDIYIQMADKCTSCDELIDLFEEMQIDFAKRMREVKKGKAVSYHVRRCIDYIYENLHERLRVCTLAEYTGLNPAYLSKLFLKEAGVGIKDFITTAKLETAENMLKFSDFSYLDIALSLGFSSQSFFITRFKEKNGITPKQYRENYYIK